MSTLFTSQIMDTLARSPNEGSVYKPVTTASTGVNTGVGVKFNDGVFPQPESGGISGPMTSAASAAASGFGSGALGEMGSGMAGAASAWKDPGGVFGGASGGGLMFPTDLGGATSMNYMGFQAFEIVGGIGSAKTDRDYEMKGTPVYLPIPDSGVNEPFNQNWGAGDVSMFEAALSGTAQGMSGSLNNALKSGNLGSDLGNQIGEVGSSLIEGGKSMMTQIGDSLGKDAVADYNTIASGVVSGLQSALKIANSKGVAQAAVGLGLQIAGQPLSQAAGLAGFKETAYLYQGPAFRPFSFTFSLKPTSGSESNTINEIIDFFRFWARPTENAGDLYRIYSLPAAWEIKFYSTSGENPYLPKLGKCVLTGFNAKYGGDRFSTFSGSHAPVQVDLTMNFMEIELQTRYADEGTAGTGAVDSFSGMAKATAATAARNYNVG